MKNLFTLALLLTPALLYAQSESYTITGKLAAIKAPAKAYLSRRTGSTVQMDFGSDSERNVFFYRHR